jgi:hypothetical protein
MATSDSHEAIEKARRRAKERARKAERLLEREDADLHLESPSLCLPSHFRSLLSDTRLDASSNASVRAEVMQSAQKTHGNRAVQRFLQVQRSPTYAEEVTDDKIAQQISSKSGTGEKLDDPVRDQLERELGTNLSHMQVHTDAEADHMARSVKAAAFTSGRDTYFQAGSFDPRSAEGLKLLAHEAAHVMQQSKGPVDGKPIDAGITLSDPSDTFEQEAERIADEMEAKRNRDTQGTQGDEAHAHEQVQRSQIEEAVPTLFNSSTLFVQRAMQPYDNCAVQRFVQRTLSVQREDDEEDFVPRFTPFPPRLDMSLGSVDASVTPGGPGLSYEGGPLHAGADFGWDGQVDLNLGYGKPLLPWRMDIDPSMAAGAEGVNSLMNKPWPPSSGTANKLFGMAGTLGDIAGAGEPSPYNWGVGIEGKLSSEEQRIMLGVGTSF